MDNEKFGSPVLIGCIFLFGVLTAFPLHGDCSQMPNQVDVYALSNEVTIKRWQLIGPFKFAKGDIDAANPHALLGGLNHDFLADLGYSEERLSTDAITSLCAEARRFCQVYYQHGADLLFDQLFPEMTYAVIYAAAKISSTKDADVGFELGSDDGAKVWLNGHLLLATRNDVDRAAFKYTHLLPVHLNKGVNFLVVKVDQKVDTWALITSFMSLDQMRLVAIQQADGHLLANRLLKSGDSPHLSLPILCEKLAMHLSIASLDGTLIISRSYNAAKIDHVRFPQLAEGYYSLTLQIGMKELHDSFYIGNTNAVYDAICSAQLKTRLDTQEYIQRDPLIKRYRILTSDQYSHPLDPNWQKKLLMVVKEGLQTLHYPTEDLWSRLPGMHLREYISKVDGTLQNYLLFLPVGVQGPLPLVLVTPYAQKPVRPFLESSLIAWPDDLEDIQSAADMSRVAVALLDGRGNVGDASIGEADAFEVLNDINSRYSIDQHRLYLYGTCEGGRRALLLAEHYPGLFAAVGVYGPTLAVYFRSQSGGHDDMFVLTDNLSSTPVILVKGEYDDSPPTAVLEAFCEKLIKSGSESQIDIIPDGMHKQKKLEQRIFPFFIKHRNARSAVSIADQYREAIIRAYP
jgi:hypothetical protein